MDGQLPDYEGYERLEGFTPLQLQVYRQMLLEKTQYQVDFIGNHVWMPHFAKSELSVVEIGSGNGRLLVGLHEQGLLGLGIGIEASKSRCNFARQWVKDSNSNIYILNKNVLDLDAGQLPYCDLAVCITGCFQYFYPISPDAPKKVLDFMHKSALYSLFELYKRPQMGRTWHELPAGDQWRYLLDEYVDTGDWVRHRKTFIGDGYGPFKRDVRVEDLAYYTMPVFLKHLNDAGFTNVHWAKENSELMVILAS